jgi:hypothetical protein
MDLVAPGLWLGDKRGAMALIAHAKAPAAGGEAPSAPPSAPTATTILNVSDKMFYMPKAPGLRFNSVPMNDFGKTRLTDALLQRCFDFIASGVGAGGGTLVHCTYGVNRSAIIVAAYILNAHQGRKGADEIILELQAVRRVVDPNDVYRAQLREMHTRWFGEGGSGGLVVDASSRTGGGDGGSSDEAGGPLPVSDGAAGGGRPGDLSPGWRERDQDYNTQLQQQQHDRKCCNIV